MEKSKKLSSEFLVLRFTFKRSCTFGVLNTKSFCFDTVDLQSNETSEQIWEVVEL